MDDPQDFNPRHRIIMQFIDFLQNGLLDLGLGQKILTFLIATQITIMGVTLYLHRDQTHRGVSLHPVLQHFFRFWLWLTTGMQTRDWVAIHRKHHSYCETENDPHSPQFYGIKRVLWDGVELYTDERKNTETLEKYGKGTPDDWLENTIYSKFRYLGVSLLLPINFVLFGVLGIAMWALQLIWIPFFAAGVVNGIGHYWGYRNYKTNDCSRNITRFGFIIGGEELHNNHHAFPSSCKFAHKKGEYDLGWYVIKLLSWLKLAKIRKVVPALVTHENKHDIDKDTVMAILTHRFSVAQMYYLDVMKPAVVAEYRQASRTMRKTAKKCLKALSIDWRFVDPNTREMVSHCLSNNQTVETVMAYRDELQKIWEQKGKNTEQMVESLKDWCQKAEQSGIETLQNFAAKLKQISLNSTHEAPGHS